MRNRVELKLNVTTVYNNVNISLTGSNPNITDFKNNTSVPYERPFEDVEKNFYTASLNYLNELRNDTDRHLMSINMSFQYAAMLRSIDSSVNRYISHVSPYFGGFNS